jgi:Flavoprotein
VSASCTCSYAEQAHAEGWSVYCIATPAAVEHFLDIPSLERETGHQVRTAYRKSGDEPLPRTDGVIVAPANYNTINKWAAGISDTYALNQLAGKHSTNDVVRAVCHKNVFLTQRGLLVHASPRSDLAHAAVSRCPNR